MIEVAGKAKKCITPSQFLSHDMQMLLGAKKIFCTLPHQFDANVFNLSHKHDCSIKSKKVTLSYHGALQFGRNIEVLLDCYENLVKSNLLIKNDTEFILRLKSSQLNMLKRKYSHIKNIIFLEGTNFSHSIFEQKHASDINILLDNGPLYSNILLGKAPVLGSIGKPFLVLSPLKSEIHSILKNGEFIASYDNKDEIIMKLEKLIYNRLNNDVFINPFEDYFGEENFKKKLDYILKN
jgi:hypothetical protein